MKNPTFDICVIGGGAAGMMAAISAAKENPKSRIVIIEKNEILGRKVLATGNGRCNLTNINASPDDYFGANRRFVADILTEFTVTETIKYFNLIGVATKEEDRGRIFPRTNQAATVVKALEEDLTNHKVEIILGTNIKTISNVKNGYEIVSEDGGRFFTKKLILTTGGRAAHQFGSNGDGLFWLNKIFNVKINEPHAALVPINLDADFLKDIMGIKTEANITLNKDNILISKCQGEVIFTHFGISGPAAMSLGRYIHGEGNYELLIDLFPEIQSEALEKNIQSLAEHNGNKSIKNIIAGFLPEKLAIIVCKNSDINITKKAAEVSKNERKTLIANLKNLKIRILSVRPLKEAQVTAGGIKVEEINPNTLELISQNGLYVAGEIIDVDGKSGGYNLQWAWSSGFLAGKSAAEEVLNETKTN